MADPSPYAQPTPNPAVERANAQRGMPEVQRAADNVRRGADSLDRDASRRDIPATAAERKRAAANDLRTYADQIESGDRKYDPTEAQLMADAGDCSGILIDGRAKPDEERQALRKLARDGLMVHVAEPGQVPFYALASYGGLTHEEVAGVAVPAEQDVDEPSP